MTEVEVTETSLIVRIEGWDRVWALKSEITIPLDRVRDAVPFSTEAAGKPWLRLPGTYLPGVIQAGSFRQDKEWVFWNVRDPEKAIVIDLVDEHYAKLVIEVDDPAQTIEIITNVVTSKP